MENPTLLAKLFLLQQEVETMRRNEEGYGYRYFDINQMITKIKPLLKKHGLMILQPLDNVDGKPAIRTIIADSKEKMEWVTPLPTSSTVTQGQNKAGAFTNTKTDPQDMGSAITYYRRYALQSLLFLEAQDDDGQQKQ